MTCWSTNWLDKTIKTSCHLKIQSGYVVPKHMHTCIHMHAHINVHVWILFVECSLFVLSKVHEIYYWYL